MKNEKIIGIILFIIVFCGATYFSFRTFNKVEPVGENVENATSTLSVGTSTIMVPAVASTITTSKFKLFYIALNDAGKNGKEIGCQDSVVGVSNTVAYTQSPLRVSLEMIINDKRQKITSDGELHNTLAASNLSLADLNLSNGIATIKLAGEYKSGGVCDDPRFVAQISETALQFPSVKAVNILLNNVPISEALSQR